MLRVHRPSQTDSASPFRKRERIAVRDFFCFPCMFVPHNKGSPYFRLLTLVLSSIEEERSRSPQWTLNKHLRIFRRPRRFQSRQTGLAGSRAPALDESIRGARET